MAQYLYDTFWDERFWFPSNRTHSWKSLENVPGSNVYYPDMKDLHWSLLLGVALIGIRYLLETFIVVPIALRLGVSNKKPQKPAENKILEAAWADKRRLTHDAIKGLAKQTDMPERKVEIWFRKRKQLNAPTPMSKFRECSWHLIFYTTFFIYALVYLWKKPYFWKTILCWDNWPHQPVTEEMYWHYVVELGFYWSLVFTVCSDHKRKDFKEMIVHHFATMVLMYFSWVLNFVRIGTIVLAVHDAADTWLALTKMSIYSKNKMATDIFFGIFLLIWILSRLVYYPFVVLYSTTFEPYASKLTDHTFGAHLFFNFFLYLLQILHIIWTYMIFRIVYRKLIKGNVEDVRSDSEESNAEYESDSEQEGKERKERKEKMQPNGTKVPKSEQNGSNGAVTNGYGHKANGRLEMNGNGFKN